MRNEVVKKIAFVLMIIALSAAPGRAEKKITVQQLKDVLAGLAQEKKSDADVATALKQVELTEQLDRDTMNGLSATAPGQLSTEQLYVLEAKSAMLPLPAAQSPQAAAPDAAAQAALLAKAFAYSAKTYAAQPHIGTTKTTLRFQDNIEAIAASSGIAGSSKDVSVSGVAGTAGASNSYVRYINATETPIEVVNGAEKLSAAKDKTPWGQNGYIALEEPDPSLTAIVADAQTAGRVTFSRIEYVNGKPAAVFDFTVDKKKSHLNINICCFPQVDQTGVARFSSAALGGGGVSGNMQTNAQWSNFKATVPYHGSLYIDPDTGIVVRLITKAEFKNSDYVRQQDTRIDYGPVQVGAQTLILPVKTFIQSDVVPQGDSGVGGQSTRHTYFTSSYKDYAAR